MRIDAIDAAARQQLQEEMLALIASRSAPPGPLRKAAAPVPIASAAAVEATPPAAAVQTERAVQEINETMKMLSTNLRFQVDEESGRTIVKVVDGESGDVLRQIPSETTLQIARSLDRLAGHLVSDRI